MDNAPSLTASTDPCVIKLDPFQYSSYQQSRLDIQSPTGKFLTRIAKPLPSKTDDDAIYQLWCQACLLEVLFDQLKERVKLPRQAINSIAHVIDRIDAHLKKQRIM